MGLMKIVADPAELGRGLVLAAEAGLDLSRTGQEQPHLLPADCVLQVGVEPIIEPETG